MKSFLMGAFLVGVVTGAFAKPTATQIEKVVTGIGPVMSVTETPMKGLYEVTTDTTIFFVDDSLTHMIGGEMYNIKTKQSVTRDAINKVTERAKVKQRENEKKTIQALDLKDAIIEKKGSGKRVMYVFTDPLCPYCKKLEQDLEKITDITIYRFLVPVKGPAAITVATNAWCNAQPLAAWKDIISGKAIPDATCPTPLDRNMQLMPLLSIRGTPTSFKPNGSRKDGAVGKDVLEAWLSE